MTERTARTDRHDHPIRRHRAGALLTTRRGLPRSRWRPVAGLAALLTLALTAAACGSSSSGGSSGASGPASSAISGSSGSSAAAGSAGSLTVADAGFTESKILAEMYAALLGKAGYKVDRTSVSSTELAQSSLEKGTVDAMPQYVATYADLLNTKVHGSNAPSVSSPDLQKSLAALRPLASGLGLSVLDPATAVDQNAFAVSKSFATEHHLTTLSDLGASGLTVKIAAGPECETRPFCQPGLEKTYGIRISEIVRTGVDTAQTKSAVQKGTAQLGLVLTTDATVSDYDLVTLTDDKKLQNADNLVPVVTTKSLTPKISDALDKLAPVFTTADLAELNKKVDAERQKPADVAQAYLRSKGLLN